MNNIRLMIVGSLICMLAASCVPKSAYVEVENELVTTRRQVQQLEQEREQEENSLNELKSKNEQTASELSHAREQQKYLAEINQRLLVNIKTLSARAKKLKVELDKHKSVVQMQDQVIKLLDDTKKTIESSLKDQMAAQGIELINTSEPLRVVLVDNILYEPGGLEISANGKKLLLALVESLTKGDNQQIVIEGHSDDTPIVNDMRGKYPSNWELSAARAAAAARFLQSEGGLAPERISIRGYGAYRPLASNDTEEGRRINRRVEIVLGPIGE